MLNLLSTSKEVAFSRAISGNIVFLENLDFRRGTLIFLSQFFSVKGNGVGAIGKYQNSSLRANLS